MSKYLIWCYDSTHARCAEVKETSLEKAESIFEKAVKSGIYASVTLRVEHRLHGYVIKTWSLKGYDEFPV